MFCGGGGRVSSQFPAPFLSSDHRPVPPVSCLRARVQKGHHPLPHCWGSNPNPESWLLGRSLSNRMGLGVLGALTPKSCGQEYIPRGRNSSCILLAHHLAAMARERQRPPTGCLCASKESPLLKGRPQRKEGRRQIVPTPLP